MATPFDVDQIGMVSSLFNAGGSRLPMPAFMYRCPSTAMNVQAWIADDPSRRDDCEAVTCLACRRIHIVRPRTGTVVGESDRDAPPKPGSGT